jgi:hypothetical protein
MCRRQSVDGAESNLGETRVGFARKFFDREIETAVETLVHRVATSTTFLCGSRWVATGTYGFFGLGRA